MSKRNNQSIKHYITVGRVQLVCVAAAHTVCPTFYLDVKIQYDPTQKEIRAAMESKPSEKLRCSFNHTNSDDEGRF